jgi:hypothetical protein
MTDAGPTLAGWTSPSDEVPGDVKSPHVAPPRYSLANLGLYCLELGNFGYGWPIAPVGHMQRDLVDKAEKLPEPLVILAADAIGFTVSQSR